MAGSLMQKVTKWLGGPRKPSTKVTSTPRPTVSSVPRPAAGGWSGGGNTSIPRPAAGGAIGPMGPKGPPRDGMKEMGKGLYGRGKY
jgi:hypothetical protein